MPLSEPCRARSDLCPSRTPAGRASDGDTTANTARPWPSFAFGGPPILPSTEQLAGAESHFCCIASEAAFPQASRVTFAGAVRVVFCTLRNTLLAALSLGERGGLAKDAASWVVFGSEPSGVAPGAKSTRSHHRGYPAITESRNSCSKSRWKRLSIRSFNSPAWTTTPSADGEMGGRSDADKRGFRMPG